MSNDRNLILTEQTRFGGESGAGMMRNRCAFTSRDMGADWPDAFTYAIVYGWDGDPDDPADKGAWAEVAAEWGWDEELVTFLRNAHQQFSSLADRKPE